MLFRIKNAINAANKPNRYGFLVSPLSTLQTPYIVAAKKHNNSSQSATAIGRMLLPFIITKFRIKEIQKCSQNFPDI